MALERVHPQAASEQLVALYLELRPDFDAQGCIMPLPDWPAAAPGGTAEAGAALAQPQQGKVVADGLNSRQEQHQHAAFDEAPDPVSSSELHQPRQHPGTRMAHASNAEAQHSRGAAAAVPQLSGACKHRAGPCCFLSNSDHANLPYTASHGADWVFAIAYMQCC